MLAFVDDQVYYSIMSDLAPDNQKGSGLEKQQELSSVGRNLKLYKNSRFNLCQKIESIEYGRLTNVTRSW